MSILSERLKIALKNKNIKQSVLAYRTGIDRSYISNYLSGKYEPKDETIKKMAEILEVSAAWLAGFDAPMLSEEVINDNITDIVIRLRNDKKFLNVVETLYTLDNEKFNAIKNILDAFL